ncbi:hypothetical protein RCCS2_08769 [Roseobacter sp. CCS2]|nr:hypothetical protein RCCS2_08769 [Roseobacter sp. CCS2]
MFFSQIILANLVSVELYGRLELTQSVAVLCALIIGLGLPASVPLVLLRDEVKARWDTGLLLTGVIAVLLLFVSAIAALSSDTITSFFVLIPLATAALLLQGLWATVLKAKGKSTMAVSLEAGFWVTILLGGALIVWGVGHQSILVAVLAIYAALLLLWTIRAYYDIRMPFDLADLRENLRVSLPLMVIGLLSVLAVYSSRIILGTFSNLEVLGLYAILFRATAVPLVGHQLLIIGLFPKLFSWDEAILKQRAVVIPLGVTVFALAFWLLVDQFGAVLGDRFAEVFVQHRVTALLILSQTVLWSAIALNDLLNSRLQIAGRVAWYAAAFLLISLPILAFVTVRSNTDGNVGSTLMTFAVWHSALMLGFYLTQCIAIWRNGHRYTLLWLSALGGYAALLVLFLFREFT